MGFPSCQLITPSPLCLSALKRSFEVEEVETPNPTPPRRVQTPLLRASLASSTQKFQDLGVRNSEPARHVDSLSQRSPKAALRRVELPGPKAEPVSRRTEISIDISSKPAEGAGAAAGPSRFGLKRAETLGHKTPEPGPRRTEVTIVKPQEPAHRRMETPASKSPEVPAAPTADAAPKRVEIQVPKPAEAPACPIPAQILENSEPTPTSQLQSRLEPKPQPPPAEAPPRSQEGECKAWAICAVGVGGGSWLCHGSWPNWGEEAMLPWGPGNAGVSVRRLRGGTSGSICPRGMDQEAAGGT